MSNLKFDSNKIKKKWKDLYTGKDKITSFINNFDHSDSKYANKVYIEESQKKQNPVVDESSNKENITDASKDTVDEVSVSQEINQDKESETRLNDQEEIVPIEPKYNLEQVEAIKKESEELGKKQGYIDGKKLGFEQGHSKGLIEGEEKGLNKGKLAAIEEAESKANEKVEIVVNELKRLFESAKKEFNKTEIIENVCRLSLHIAETICRGLHYKNPNQLIELIKFNLSKIIPEDNKLLSVFLSPNDFDNYGSLIQEKLPYKISPHSEISNGAIRIKLDENQYEDNFHSNLLSIAKDILSRDDFEKYKEEKSNSTQSFDKPQLEEISSKNKNPDNKISPHVIGDLSEDSRTFDEKAVSDHRAGTEEFFETNISEENSNLSQNESNLTEDSRTFDEKAVGDDKSETEEVVEGVNRDDNSNLLQNEGILIEDNQNLRDKAVCDDESKTEEIVDNNKNEDSKYFDQNMSDVKENKLFLDQNLKDTNLSITSDLSQKTTIDPNSHPDSNNENFKENDLEEIKENSNSKISDNDNNKP